MTKLFAIVPLGVGLTVLGFLWFTPFNQFGSPPLFFRLFGSFVALAFVLTGASILKGGEALSISRLQKRAEELNRAMRQPDSSAGTPAAGSSAGYICPSCNAPLGDGSEVSPQGDVKCGHCGRWFNVHA